MRTCGRVSGGGALTVFCALALACSSSTGGGRTVASGSGAPGNSANEGDGASSGSTIGDAGLSDDAGLADDAAGDASTCTSYSGTLDSYSANLSKTGSSGQIQFVLVDSQPAPPGKGDNVWTLKLLDAAGAPIQKATFAIKTWMPLMHHGSSIAPQQTANANGTYSISNLYLIMPGIWQVTFTAQAGSMKDTATYTFCVGG